MGKQKNYLYKDKQAGIITGVCQGLGEFFHISPWIFRVIFILPVLPVPFSFISGVVSIVIYSVLSVFLKDKKTAEKEDNVVEVEYEVVDDDEQKSDKD